MSRKQVELYVPAITPFKADLSIDVDRFIAHSKFLLASGAHGLAPFGSTSEANSLSVGERMDALDKLLEAGISASALIPGTGCSAAEDTDRLTEHAIDRGCKGVLVLPPFFYKNVPEDGVFAAFSNMIQSVGEKQLRIYLYHIPQMSGVPITLSLIERLLKAYPDTIVGLKDSSGNWDNTAATIDAFPQLDVYSASESLIPQNVQRGGAGCISASSNVNAAGIRKLIDGLGSDEEPMLLEQVASVRKIFESIPLIPGIKAAVAGIHKDDNYKRLRPPFAAVGEEHTSLIDQAIAISSKAASA